MPKKSLIDPRKYIYNLGETLKMELTLAIIAAFGGEFLVETEAMVSVDSLHSTLKPVTRPLDTNHKKAAFKDNEKLKISAHEITSWVTRDIKVMLI